MPMEIRGMTYAGHQVRKAEKSAYYDEKYGKEE